MAEALTRLCPKEKIETSDLISEAMPFGSDVCKSMYQFAITHWPAGWRMVYDLMGRRSLTGPDAVWQSAMVNALKQRIERQQPRLIISTYPLYAILLETLAKRQAVPPLCTVITDSISVNRVWVMAGSNLFCVADDETKKVVIGFGVPESKIRVTGFPVDLAFTEPLPEQPPHQRARILYLPSTTARRVADTLEALKPLFLSGVKLTLPVGKHDKRLYHVTRRFTDSMPPDTVEIIGWTKRIPEFLRTHDVVICKAGGAILHEVMAAQIPAVIDYIVPGQEEGNAEMLTKHDGGIITKSAKETAAAVESILTNNSAVGRRMRGNMAKISMPDAAVRTAKAALTVASA